MITQDAFTSGKSLIGTILDKMVGIKQMAESIFYGSNHVISYHQRKNQFYSDGKI
jgi:hypothetical protein